MRQTTLLISLLIASTALPRFIGAQVLTVNIYNVSAANKRDIADLKEAATAIFDHAKIKIVWADCTLGPETCDGVPSVNNITLRVINEQGHTGYHAIGWTTLGTYLVTIHYRRAEKMSRASTLGLSCGRILGYTAAHEIGHLVLGSPNHELFGIMKEAYDNRDLLTMAQGRLYFSEGEARKMLNRLKPSSEVYNDRLKTHVG